MYLFFCWQLLSPMEDFKQLLDQDLTEHLGQLCYHRDINNIITNNQKGFR
jgi:hypothetical protein